MLRLALLGNVLRYANIIAGLSETARRQLRSKLQIQSSAIEKERLSMVADWRELFEGIPAGLPMIALVGSDDFFFCCELSFEYIDFIGKVIKPHLKE